MEAILKIYGDIGSTDPMVEMFGITDDTVSSKIVSDFLDEHKDADSVTVKINSRGGDVQEGWSIHDLLVNSGKKIKTIGEGKVYSIATIVFLAGSEREMMKNADGLIHNPYIPPYTLAGAYGSDDLIKIAESLAQEEEKILDFYAKETGTDKAKLAEYMKEDTKLSAEDMLTLGFATKIIEPIKAYAYVKPINKFNMTNDDVKTFGQKLDAIIAKISGFSRLPVTDQTMTDKDGKEFKLEKEAGAPVVGDAASPDGSYTMADGKVVVVAGGKVTEIKEPAAAKTELEVANEKIVELEAKVAAAETAKVTTETEKAELEAEKVKATALVTELTALKNTWKPQSRSKSFANEAKIGEIDLNRVRELNQKLINK
jgi:ATP-dependent protease ClpP protease subunit